MTLRRWLIGDPFSPPGAAINVGRMCNRYGYVAPVSRLAEEFNEIRIPLVFKGGAIPNVPPRDHIRPTDSAPILRPIDPKAPQAVVEIVDARWWLIPFFHKGGVKDWKPMCTNARAETVATTATFREPFKRRRCLVPATHFFEWTGRKGAKVMHRFTHDERDLFCFAGLWDRANTVDGPIESFTIITCAAGPDCAPYHNRQPVILERDHWATWLDLTANAAPLRTPGRAGEIHIELARDSVSASDH
jgi:putative SOS response-associated peptidase YedK